VRHHGSGAKPGAKRFHHHVVGALTLAYEGLEMVAEPGLTLTVYAAEPGSPSEQALRLLAPGPPLREQRLCSSRSPPVDDAADGHVWHPPSGVARMPTVRAAVRLESAGSRPWV
jgi:hypothetical protein